MDTPQQRLRLDVLARQMTAASLQQADQGEAPPLFSAKAMNSGRRGRRV